MKKNKVIIDQKLIKDLEKYSTTVCKSLATQTREEMYKTAQYAIEEFYNDYDPIYYKRHYCNFKKNSFEKYYKNPHGSIIRGGVELTPYELDDLYRADSEYVFNLVYSGFHGNVNMLPTNNISNVPHIMSPSPLDILLDKRDYIVNNIEDYKKEAQEKANNNSYNTLII